MLPRKRRLTNMSIDIFTFILFVVPFAANWIMLLNK
jgi:hypothetical protein